MQGASTVMARRSSAIVSQNLGAILGKVNNAASSVEDSAEAAAAAALALNVPVASKAHSQAFFPELIALTKVWSCFLQRTCASYQTRRIQVRT